MPKTHRNSPSFADAAPDEPLVDANWDLVPVPLRAQLLDYFQIGMVPGSFLIAVLSNDLKSAVMLADEMNLARLADLVRFLYNYAPSPSWGSGEAIADWESFGGLDGIEHGREAAQ